MKKKYLISVVMLLTISFVSYAQPLTFIVASDGSGTHSTVQSAVDACLDGQRNIIFIKNGTYEEQVSIGSKASPSTKLISLIGESRDGVVITSSQYRTNENKLSFEDVVTVQIYANDFYAENLTIQNTAGDVSQAEALYNGADRQTFKNCKISGYQDTHRSKKGARCYFKACWIEGSVDFIYAGGVIFFDDCTINSVRSGYVVAPEDATNTILRSQTECNKSLRIGFFFRDCKLTANADVSDNSCYLGRPWNTSAGAFYLNCELGKHINVAGWQAWNGNETTASFAEYQSRDTDGNLLDVSKRVSWSFQLPQRDADTFMNPEYIYKLVNTSVVYDPVSFCLSLPEPEMNLGENMLSWNSIEGAIGYVIYKNNKYFTVVTGNSYQIDELDADYAVKAIAENGSLSDRYNTVSNKEILKDNQLDIEITKDYINFPDLVDLTIYTLNGTLLHKQKQCLSFEKGVLAKGLYIFEYTANNIVNRNKIVIY